MRDSLDLILGLIRLRGWQSLTSHSFDDFDHTDLLRPNLMGKVRVAPGLLVSPSGCPGGSNVLLWTLP